jgi:hypothetical protein
MILKDKYSKVVWLFILCLIGHSSWVYADASNRDQPVIAFHETTFDFGKQMTGLDLSHVFVFINKGNLPLVIEKVSPG